MPQLQNDLKTARGDLRGLRTDAMPSSRKARIHLLTPGQSLASERGGSEGPGESPLTSWGRYRTSLFSTDLMRIPFAGIHAGEGFACRETAAILSAGRSVAVTVDSALTGHPPSPPPAPLTLHSWAAGRARTPLRGYPEAKRGTK